MDSALIQRFKFGSRVQQPGETASDFLFSLKLQAEYCNFKGDKQDRILDRVLIGLSDDALRQKLLAEDGDKLNLAQVEKIISTWELAASNAKTLTHDHSFEQIASIVGSRDIFLQRMADSVHGCGPMKRRLGYRYSSAVGERNAKPYYRHNNRVDNCSQFKQVRSHQDQHRRHQDALVRPGELKNESRIVIDRRVCDYCGVPGHIRRRCLKLNQFKRSPINNINLKENSTNTDDNLSSEINCWEDKTDDSDQDYSYGAQKSNKDRA
ncbi:uncharacterized protein LOC134214397 [Armigeres subalbatus]|uniref:uncharacterized protein LOC134214397 n=1 Tax=Armigeres subalbatus TaxID=124917 RepID=UPI002ED66B52